MGIHDEMVVSELRTRLGNRLQMVVQGLEIGVLDGSRVDLDLVIGLEILKLLRTTELEGHFLVIQRLQQQNVLTLLTGT